MRCKRLLALREVGVGEGDHRLVELGVVHDLADLDRERAAEVAGVLARRRGGGIEGHRRQRCQRRQAAGHLHAATVAPAAAGSITGSGGSAGRRVVIVRRIRAAVAELGRRRAEPAAPAAVAGRCRAGRPRGWSSCKPPSPTICCSISSILALTPLSGAGAAVGQADLGVVEPRRVAQRRQLLGRQAFAAHLAQHVELALAHEIVAPLALDHRLELGLLELELARRRPGAS